MITKHEYLFEQSRSLLFQGSQHSHEEDKERCELYNPGEI